VVVVPVVGADEFKGEGDFGKPGPVLQTPTTKAEPSGMVAIPWEAMLAGTVAVELPSCSNLIADLENDDCMGSIWPWP
jgi:hypothetical protein